MVIVKDENGKEISVTDNGDGTYSYEQPERNVTIEVIFKDKDVTGPDKEAASPEDEKDHSDDTNKGPETGDDANVWLWSCLMVVSVMGLGWMLVYGKKKE